MVDRYFALCNEVASDLDGLAQKAAAQHLADLVGLLLGTDPGRARKVSDVAYTVGFNDLSYFNRSFRRRFGTSPSGMQMEFGQEQ